MRSDTESVAARGREADRSPSSTATAVPPEPGAALAHRPGRRSLGEDLLHAVASAHRGRCVR